MISRDELLEDLKQRTNRITDEVRDFEKMNDAMLRHKLAGDGWNVLECIEHLRYYSNFYLPEISKRISTAPPAPEARDFRPGWLGDYFAKMMLPGEKSKKISTFKSMNPAGKKLDRQVLQAFLQQQQVTSDLLEEAMKIDLNKTRASISIAPWMTLRLGDVFRVVIYHNERHIVQAQNVISSLARVKTA